MKVETTRFGTIDIREEEIITMPFGMPGFSDQKQFVLLDHKKESPFQWYQLSLMQTLFYAQDFLISCYFLSVGLVLLFSGELPPVVAFSFSAVD